MPTTKKAEPKEKKPVAPKKKVPAKKPVAEDTEAVLEAEEAAASEHAKGGSFIGAVGRRKTSVARVKLIKNGKGGITVNAKPMEKYFTTYELRDIVVSPMKAVGQDAAVDVSASVHGGGIRGQAESVRLGIARALIDLNPTFRAALKKLGYLTRDSRKRERKKYGHTGARRSPQWSKR